VLFCIFREEAVDLEVVEVNEAKAHVPAPVEEEREKLARFQQLLKKTPALGSRQNVDRLVQQPNHLGSGTRVFKIDEDADGFAEEFK
jgi:hypothetical protein